MVPLPVYHRFNVVVNTPFNQPIPKLVEKRRVGNKVIKKYDTARMPYQRVLGSPNIYQEDKGRLRQLYPTLNPVALRHGINANLDRLRNLAR